jgi:predicted ArsR family transcriptional regulator
MTSELDQSAQAVSLLGDELRRRMYRFVRSSHAPVTREEVAAHVGISRKLAAFHLDRMVDAGLLTATYARPAGRGGPGAGRSAKHYAPSDLQVEISLPERHYDLAGSLLVEAIMGSKSDETSAEAALRVARDRGRSLGREVRNRRGLPPRGGDRDLAIAEMVVRDEGYEPYHPSPDVVALRNCPFHVLARQSPELICSMNRSFLDGLLRGLGNRSAQAVLECKPGDCCVTLRMGRGRRGAGAPRPWWPEDSGRSREAAAAARASTMPNP